MRRQKNISVQVVCSCKDVPRNDGPAIFFAICLIFAFGWFASQVIGMILELQIQVPIFACLGGVITVGGIGWFVANVVHHPERVPVMLADGRQLSADVVGASKLKVGEWQRTKARLYGKSGEWLWDKGDGFEVARALRKEYGPMELRFETKPQSPSAR